MYQVEFLPKAAEDFAKLDQAVAGLLRILTLLNPSPSPDPSLVY